MRPDTLNSRVLLFLKSVQRLELVDSNNGTRRVVQRIRLGDGTYEIQETSNAGTTQERWVLFSTGPIPVPDDIRNDPFTQNWNRDAATHRAVTIAFKLGEDGGLEAVSGTVHMGVFSYLPLREETTRLKFLVQADFLTTIGRTRIQDELPWNRWLAEQVLKLIKNKAADLFAQPQWRPNALEILWPERSYGSDFFATNIERPLVEYLQRDVTLPAHDGTWVTPQEALYVPDPDMWEVVGSADLMRLYGRKPLAQDIKVPFTFEGPEIVWRLPDLFGNSNNPGFVSSSEGQSLLTEKASEQDIQFFKLLYRKMAEPGWVPSTYRRSHLARASIVLASDGTVGRHDQVFFRPKDVPASLEGRFKFVHPALAGDEAAREFLELIGVKELSEEQIRRAVSDSIIPDLRERWPHLPDEARRASLVELKAMVERGDTDTYFLRDFLTLPTKSGKWLQAEDLLFAREYSPDPDIESLVGGLLVDPSLEFVAGELGDSPDELQSWKRFLQDLGVGARARSLSDDT